MRGRVAVADLPHAIDAYAAIPGTIGLSVPRSMMGGIDPMALSASCDES